MHVTGFKKGAKHANRYWTQPLRVQRQGFNLMHTLKNGLVGAQGLRTCSPKLLRDREATWSITVTPHHRNRYRRGLRGDASRVGKLEGRRLHQIGPPPLRLETCKNDNVL